MGDVRKIKFQTSLHMLPNDEKEAYEKMNKALGVLDLGSSGQRNKLSFSGFIDSQDKSKTFMCHVLYVNSPVGKLFGCNVNVHEEDRLSGRPVVTATNIIPHFLRLYPNEDVQELRYGDIDGDKDIDIAIQLNNGAIFLFENITAEPGQQ